MKKCFLLTCKYNKKSICLAKGSLEKVCPIELEKGKICTRCDKILKAGKNIKKRWHIPICNDCRMKIMRRKNLGLIEEETEIMEKRLKKYPI